MPNNEKHTILIADDEDEIRDLLRVYLEKDGYRIIEAADGMEALSKIETSSVDLAILDIMMPGMDGIKVLKKIREDSNIPIIILSSRSGDYDRILGLDLGADDYIVKPFNPLEVLARVSANIRRFYQLGDGITKEAEKIQYKDLTLDTESCVLYIGDQTISLTGVEYRVLLLMMEHPGRVYTKQQIYEAGWLEQQVVDDNSIMVCISKLRAKLGDQDGRYIKTIRGLGYRFEK